MKKEVAIGPIPPITPNIFLLSAIDHQPQYQLSYCLSSSFTLLFEVVFIEGSVFSLYDVYVIFLLKSYLFEFSESLEVIVSSANKNAITQVKKFLQYIEKNFNGVQKGVKHANINDIRVRYYNPSGKMDELYQGTDLNEDKYSSIVSQIKNE